MAQIIKHRRGNLEVLKDATTRAGELLVVTGSSGLGTIANGANLVFVGIDGSTATPVNKILQGTTVPNLTGASYNTHVDGIPFYDTDDNKLYILNKGGNIEVKASPETGGTGIISGSAQLANSTVSNESLNAATGSYLTGTIDISSGTNLAVSDTTEVNMILTGDTISAELIGGVVSGSAQITGITNTQLAGSIANAKLANSAITISGTSVSLGGAITDETLFGGVGVVTGSAQIVSAVLNQATDFGSGRVSGEDFGDVAGTTDFTGSFIGDGSSLTGIASTLDISGSSGNGTVALKTQDLTITGTANEVETSVSGQTVTIGLPNDVTIGNDLTVAGDLLVQGTTTEVDSATLDISGSLVRINYGGGAVQGGLEVTDKTASSLTTGSLLWDGTNDYWIGGKKGSEVQLATISGTETLTNKTINGSQLVNSSVANGKLANDGITIAGVDTSLGGTITLETITGGSGIQSGSILNADLANSAITISGTSVSLGGAITDETLFGGTGVVSGSAQLANSTVSNESLNSATGSYLTTVDISSNTNLAVSDTTEVNMILTGDTISAELIGGVVSGSAQITSAITGGDLDMGGNKVLFGNVYSALGDLPNASSYHGMFAHVHATGRAYFAHGGAWHPLVNVSDGAHSGSAQVVSALSNQATDFGSGRISGDNFGDSAGSSTFTGSFSGSYQGDGSGLSGVASTLDVSGSSGNGSVALSTQDLSIVGTSNEIETSVSGQTVTIGIPTNPTLTGNTTITGNLTVEGTTTAIDSTTVNIGDRILELNYAGASGDAGILVSDVDGTSTSGSLLWDASSDYWMAGALGSEKEIALLNAAPTTNTVLKANASGLLVDSAISDDGTAITISSNLIVSGLTAGAFLVSNGSKQLISVASSTDGDVLVSDGSGGYSATNTIDGGTF